MFDWVDVQVPLPDGSSAKGRGFQTKDFACDMGTVTITRDGRHHDEPERPS